MQILDYAMQMELDGEKYYRELATTCPDAGIRGMLEHMADAEVKHYETLKQMKAAGVASMADDVVRPSAKNLFKEMMDSGETFDFNVSELSLYEKARDVEYKARDFYLEHVDEVASEESRALFKQLADEEGLHADILSSVIEFVGQAEPGNWVEAAEWYKTEDY
ncbi:MAG: ferritin family protein [Verrucomicrobia bacterium]|jgi:rubrerythrin|nr:ferritin family protein [Verrucomicrobiota bacterium]